MHLLRRLRRRFTRARLGDLGPFPFRHGLLPFGQRTLLRLLMLLGLGLFLVLLLRFGPILCARVGGNA